MTFKKILIPILIFLAAAIIYQQYGFDRGLSRNESIYLYAGQQMAKGIPPHVSICDQKMPLSSMFMGLGVFLSEIFHKDDVLTVRLLFFIMSCLTCASVYLLGKTTFNSELVGFFAALTFLAFNKYAQDAASGPQAKTPTVLFEILSLLLTSQRKWFWAGICGSLSFLTWQPMAMFPFTTFIFALMQPKDYRLVPALKVAAGTLLPVLAMILYFLSHHALFYLINDTFLFCIYFLDRGPLTFLDHFFQPLYVLEYHYSKTIIFIFVGLLTIAFLSVKKIYYFLLEKKRTLDKDPFSPILISFLLPFVWSFIDFQGSPDFYLFLPYVSMGFGYFLRECMNTAVILGKNPKTSFSSKKLNWISGITITLILLFFIEKNVVPSTHGLIKQKRIVNKIVKTYGKDVKIVSVGCPEPLILLHKTNPNRYLYIKSGIDSYIQNNTPGGFSAWLQQLQLYNPDVIAFGHTNGKYTEHLLRWIEENYKEKMDNPWHIYVKKTPGTMHR